MKRNRILVLVILILVFNFSFSSLVRGDERIVLGGARISESALAVADFNNDGKKEIVAGGIDGMVYVIDGATYTVMWKIQITDYYLGYSRTDIYSGITVADLNRDGRLEIIVATGDDPLYHQIGLVMVVSYVGGSAQFAPMPGWPRLAFDELGSPISPSLPDKVPDGFQSTPAAGDLDGDGDLEIVVVGRDRRLHAWHHNGNYVAGWPMDRENSILRGGAGSPALADIDRDGLMEIMVGLNSYYYPGCPNPYIFLAINGDTSIVPGFPVLANQIFHSSPAIGDINGDGWLDIVVGTGDYSESCGGQPDGRKVYAWTHTGQLLPGWPKTTAGNMMASPALGDLDGDGDLEVVIGCGAVYEAPSPTCTYLYAWHGDGTPVQGFPMSPVSPETTDSSIPELNTQPFGPILADYDGDNQVEIMTVGAESRGIAIVEPTGAMNPEKHRVTKGALYTTPVVEDIDGDYRLETVIGGVSDRGTAAIYIWEETGTIYHRRPWPMFHHDVARTGLYTAPPPQPQLGISSKIYIFHDPQAGDTATSSIFVYNQGIGQLEWQLTNWPSNIQMTPPTGTAPGANIIQMSVPTSGLTHDTWHHVGDVTISSSILGQPLASSPHTVPIYLYIGQFHKFYFPIMAQNASLN